jgi:diguanylate cyclase (GGDEF)-like protein
VGAVRAPRSHARRAPRDRRDHRDGAAVHGNPAEALALVGDALAATHNPRALLPVILEVVTEATGARGGRVVEGGEVVSWTGEVDRPANALVLELSAGETPTELVLYAPAAGFSDDTRTLAEWLASQAAIALENARLHHTVQRQAITDELTGLVNRRRFLEALGSEIVRAGAFETPLSVVLADLDDFKLVNDRFGHYAGDDVLRGFADLVRAHLRDVDVPGRLGGEEFAIIVPETDALGAEAVAERVRRSLAALRVADAPEFAITASFGVAEYVPGEGGDALLRRADDALYGAKRRGKNRVVVDGGPADAASSGAA